MSGLSDRTNNKIEGWHSRIGGLAYKKRGSHEAILDLLKSEQHTSEALLIQQRSGKRICLKRRRIYDNIDNRSDEYTTELNAGERNRMEFLRAASFLVAQFGNALDGVAA